MSEAELNELILISAGQIDSSFEYWLTISFGVLIATHVTRRSIPLRLKFLICGLYLAGSVSAILLTLGDMMQIFQYAEQLKTPLAGIELGATSDVIRFLIYLIGTLSISTAIFRYERWTGDSGH